MPDYHIPLHPDKTYHVFSRGVGAERLFINDENYRFFLSKYSEYINPIADTFSFALLPNHFHFMIRIKGAQFIESHFNEKKKLKKLDPALVPDFIMERFSNFLNSYTKSFNKVYNRKGALFMDYLRRVEVLDDHQFSATLFYIHKNPVHHGYCKSMFDWKWTSYKAYLNDDSTFILKKDVLDWLGGKEAFLKFHEQPVDLKKAVIIE
jgi:putative transposase